MEFADTLFISSPIRLWADRSRSRVFLMECSLLRRAALWLVGPTPFLESVIADAISAITIQSVLFFRASWTPTPILPRPTSSRVPARHSWSGLSTTPFRRRQGFRILRMGKQWQSFSFKRCFGRAPQRLLFSQPYTLSLAKQSFGLQTITRCA